MKKFFKSLVAVASALAIFGFGFIGCSSGDDDDDGGSSGGSGGSSSTSGTITLYKNGDSQGTKSDLAAAFEAIPESGSDTYLITLTTGTYNVTGLTVKTSNSITIKGLGTADYGQDVIIYGQGSDMTQESKRSTLSFQGSCDVVLKNLTVQNSYGTTTGDAQAEALGVGPTAHSGTLAAYNCSFLSGQDTICTEGKAWFYKCYVEGDVDFLWIESRSSKVALYEDCVLHAIGTRTTKAYFAAPRLPVANTVGKGVVIFNSTLKADSNLKEVYLGRNPWDKDNDTKKGTSYFDNYYENIAVVGSTWEGPATLNDAIWYGSGANGTSNQQFVGFKTDSNFSASSNASTNGSAVLTDDQVTAEYGDRNLILNRVYNISGEAFENDSDSSIWDVSSLESEFGATASSALPTVAFDATKAKVVWNFAGTLNGETTAYQSSSGTVTGTIDNYDGTDYSVEMHINAASGKFSARSDKGDTQINSGTILTVPATNGTIVSVTKSSGSFGIEEETDTTTYTYSGDAAGIIVYCTGSGYITEITVSNLDLAALSTDILAATATGQVRAVGVTPSTTSVMQGGTTTLTATKYVSYGYDASSDSVDWSSSDENIATVSDGKVSGVASSGTTTITATCNEHSGTCTVTAEAAQTWAQIAAEDYTWDDADTVQSKDNINLQNATGFWHYMYIDASSGKFATNGGSWIDCQNTTIYIPMTKDGTITINLYATSQYTSVTGGSTTLTEDSTNKKYIYSYTTSEVVTGATIKNGSSIDGIEDDYTYAKITFVNTSGSKYIGDILRTY